MSSIIQKAGFETNQQYIYKIVLPMLFLGIIIFFVTLLSPLPFYVPYLILLFFILLILFLPYILIDKIKCEIDEQYYFFITHAQVLSTLDINNKIFFEKLSSHNEDKLNKFTKKINYFATTWNLGYANACRKISKIIPSKLFANFILNLSSIIDSGTQINKFIYDERESTLKNYQMEFQNSLKNIEIFKEIFSSLIITSAFVISGMILMPMLSGKSLSDILIWAIFALIILKSFLFFYASNFLFNTKIFSKEQNNFVKKLYLYFAILFLTSILVYLILHYLTHFSFLLKFSISTIPLLLIAYMAINEEKNIFSRNKTYPLFITSLGNLIQTSKGSLSHSLENIKIHSFGKLDSMVNNLVRRIKLKSDLKKSFALFSKESGSNLISKFTKIFIHSIQEGTDAKTTSKIISNNINQLNSLQDEKSKLISTFKATSYATFFGFIIAILITFSIGNYLYSTFDSVEETNFFNNIPDTDVNSANFLISLMIIIQALTSSLIIKILDGGNKFAFFLDFTIMLFIGTIMMEVIPKLMAFLI